ncbi:hybrid sensor histidine kinase/response regulator transcription factor [Flectobacillus roseus]|uniref:histidine kinase n=1 Tax=Flectobacillus roseus TaxID=502259 RepID=A0ABT6Y734_9BACT|nr:hybrid sensor histidine kinase/response regulator transcription factor [Flectobacillus roseus]MDI9859384.1 two-component regulator propeller domain-containing protein [Flectobacillus roseus]
MWEKLGRFYSFIFLLFNLGASLSVLPSFAQFDPNKFRFEKLTVEDGLPHSDALASVQDKEGFIWIATNKGLCRYDGYILRNYLLPKDDELALPNDRIKTLHVSSDGKLWAGTESNGLYVYDSKFDKFCTLDFSDLSASKLAIAKVLNRADVSSLASDKYGFLWVGTYRLGLFKLKLDSKGHITDISRPKVGNQASEAFPIINLKVDRFQQVWIATDRGLFFGKSSVENYVPCQLPFDNLQQFTLDKSGNIWVASKNQLYWISPSQTVKLQGSYPEVQNLLADSDGNLWIASESEGLIMIPAKISMSVGKLPVDEVKVIHFNQLTQRNGSYHHQSIRDLYEDFTKTIWISSQAIGVSRLDLRQKQFGYICPDNISGLAIKSSHYIKAIYLEEVTQKLWLGTWAGMFSYDMRHQTYEKYQAINSSFNAFKSDIASILKTKNGNLYVSAYSAGLLKLGADHKFHTIQSTTTIGSLSALEQDHLGQIWVSSNTQGLCLFNSKDGSILSGKQIGIDTPTGIINNLLVDQEKQILWVATRNGLLKYQIGLGKVVLVKRFLHEKGNVNSLKMNYIWALCKDKIGNLWIGTIGGGLHKLTTNQKGQDFIYRYDQQLPEQDVESILVDGNNELWIGGTGLYHFLPSSNQYISYDVNDGLQSNSFKIGAAWKSSQGTLFFGGIKGVSYFQPNVIKKDRRAPIPHIVGLRVGNQQINPGDTLNGRVLLIERFYNNTSITLHHDENDFAISFVGLNYANPHKNIYAYRLIGNSDNWITIQQQRLVNFANLSAGTYTFEVKVANGDRVWSSKVASIQIIILPPWWHTWWAYLLYFSLIFFSIRYYFKEKETQRNLKNQVLIESLKYEKEKELSEMKLTFFTNVSHELRTPLTLILGPIEELVSAIKTSGGLSEKAHLVQKQTKKLLDLVNQLLEFRKAESGLITLVYHQVKAVSFLSEIFHIFKLKAEEHQIKYIFNSQIEEIPVWVDKDKLEIIVINLLSNAFKFTPSNGSVSMSLGTQILNDEPYLSIKIQDSGIGINNTELSRIFDPYYQALHSNSLKVTGTGIGLSLVKQLVDAHSGYIQVQSEPQKGTTFTVLLPLKNERIAENQFVQEESFLQNSNTEVFHQPQANIELTQESTPNQDLHILIVEDNAEIRLYLQVLFEKMYKVSVATNGREGVEKALQLIPDVVLSDIMMPEMNGLELCKTLRQNAKTSHIPILLLTARTASVHEIEGLELGADDYIHKPFNPYVLFTKVTMLLQNRLRLREYYSKQLLQEPTQVVIPQEEKVFLEKAMKIVEDNLETESFNVQALQREMGMSQPVFYRKIKGITGKSGVEFIRDIRLKRAAQLLGTSNYRVSEVASMVGIEDLKYFRQHFQDLFGMAPSEFAKTKKVKE